MRFFGNAEETEREQWLVHEGCLNVLCAIYQFEKKVQHKIDEKHATLFHRYRNKIYATWKGHDLTPEFISDYKSLDFKRRGTTNFEDPQIYWETRCFFKQLVNMVGNDSGLDLIHSVIHCIANGDRLLEFSLGVDCGLLLVNHVKFGQLPQGAQYIYEYGYEAGMIAKLCEHKFKFKEVSKFGTTIFDFVPAEDKAQFIADGKEFGLEFKHGPTNGVLSHLLLLKRLPAIEKQLEEARAKKELQEAMEALQKREAKDPCSTADRQ